MPNLASVTTKIQDALAEALAAAVPPPIVEPITIEYEPVGDLSRVVSLKVWYTSHAEYEREERILELKTSPVTIEFQVTNIALGGGVPSGGLMYPIYAIELDGIEFGRFTKGTDTSGNGKVTGALDKWAKGCAVKAKIIPYDINGNKIVSPVEIYITSMIWINLDGSAKDWPYVYADTGNFALVRPSETYRVATPKRHAIVKIPKSRLKLQPALPLPVWTEAPPMLNIRSGLLTRTNITPCPEGGSDLSMHIPCQTNTGIITLQNRQAYYWSDLISPIPMQQLKDGPRGICTTTNVISIYHGRNGKKYCCDPWSWYVVDNTGTKRTLLGLRSKNQDYPKHWQEVTLDDFDLIGDWSAVPIANRRLNRCWDAIFDPRTTVTDPNAAPIGGEQPHPGPVVAFLVTEDGIVFRAEFNGSDRSVPPKITIWISGLKNSWGMKHRILPDGTGELFITERMGHCVSVWSMDTPQTLKRTLAKSNNVPGSVSTTMQTWAYYDTDANVSSGAAAATLRKNFPTTLVAPEGIDWYGSNLAIGSYALGEARLIDPDTGAFKGYVCRPFMSWGNKGHFMHVAVSDGVNGGGEFGTTFISTFAEQANYGHPECFLPDAGTASDGTPLTNAKKFTWAGLAWDLPYGPGYKTMGGTYPLCTGLGKNEITAGDTQDGLKLWRMSSTAEQNSANWPDVNKFTAGAQVMRTRQDQLIFGSQYQRRLTDEPLPKGIDTNLDYLLTYLGY